MKNFIRHIPTVFLTVLLGSCDGNTEERFELMPSSRTGIGFENMIVENDTINVFEYMNVYTGAGVAVGDVDNDGYTDVYFSGNAVSGRLYRNKGNFEFEDITEKSGLIDNRWGTGATMVDINQDGLLDIYVCVSGAGEETERANLLYINNGPSEQSGVVKFTERGKEYGLADTRQSMQAAFFDYDKDNDLDMYLLVNQAAYEYKVNISQPRVLDGSSISNDRLYRNEGNGTFTDVTLEAGILIEGYGLGVGVSDINGDSWPDVYVSNDFIGNDILYINQKDGTFKDEITNRIKHTSYAGMGNDIADVDNNGEPDILVLDMRPEDNKRQKLIISSTGYDRFQLMLKAGYNAQYSRNTLQLNNGGEKFSEVGFLAGISSTDWSWSPLLADYDNDGHKDLYVTNGFLRDLGNLDYIHYQGIYDNPLGDREVKIKQKQASIQELPKAQLLNYAYKNKGDMTFEKVTDEWGFEEPSCSNGAAYADLDNDGDLDLLVNNLNQQAFVYRNLSDQNETNNFIRIKLKGAPGNVNGIGTKIKVTTTDSDQYYQHYLSRGYESSIDPIIHFGLGNHTLIKRLEIWWPDGRYQLMEDRPANKLLIVDQSNAVGHDGVEEKALPNTVFKELADSLGVVFRHREDEVVDFKLQPILPHMHSRNGPGIAVADVNKDGLEDFYVGGATDQAGALYLQHTDGTFDEVGWNIDAVYEDMGSLFFDANGDGHQDLYVVSGGVQIDAKSDNYQDRLYLNDGSGNFKRANALPEIKVSGSCATASDFDKDGDLDLFVGGRVDPGNYPLPVQSFLLENNSEKYGRANFKNIANQIEGWDRLTMVTSALWTDYDDDGWTDLIVVGEFMPITFFHNINGKLVIQEEINGLTKTEGWWNSIHGGDFDQDGDTDYILGNLGLNTKYRASQEEPLCIYASDYDKDGRMDPVMCYYIEGENHMAHSRDEIIGQINAMRGRFQTYESYASTPFSKSFLPEELEAAYVVKSHNFASSYLKNLGNGAFELIDLPIALQTAPIEGIVVDDIDLDGKLDVLLTGNSYATEASTGRYDAFIGTFLKGKGDGTFERLPVARSGFDNDLDASGLALIRTASEGKGIVSANNDGKLKMYIADDIGEKNQVIAIDPGTQHVQIELQNGLQYKLEGYYGSGYLSQSSNSIPISKHIKNIRFIDVNGQAKTVYSNEDIE